MPQIHKDGTGGNKRCGKSRAEFGTGDKNRYGKRGRLMFMNEKCNFWPKATGESMWLLKGYWGKN